MPQKMMIVDKEPADLRRLERLFGPTYQVLCATSGEEALRLLAQHDVALLITDQPLPCMTGTELLEQAARLRPHMVRLILTAHADAEALADAINRGQVYRYAKKPWDDEDLRLTVVRALQHYEVIRSRHEADETNNDAMTSPRPFRDALGHERAVRALNEGAGTQFDPEVVAAFCGLEALAQIRGHIARGDFGSRFLLFAHPAALRVLPLEELVRVADAVATANDSSEMASLDALTPDRLALLRLTRADLARVHEMTTEMVGERFDSVAA
jgi:response regulator RpfG family c-di-GMP phosphodiesterase